MNQITQLPETLWSIRDAVIEATHKGEEAPRELSLIHDWLENDGWTELVDQNPNGELAVSIQSFCFDDAELRALTEVDESILITDEMRIHYTRERLQELNSGSFSYDYSEITFCRLENNVGRSVVLGAMFKAQQGGWEVYWVGLFTTAEQFFHSMKLNGLWTVGELDSIDDDSILQFWSK
jgi:hypothetical protein